LINCLPEKEIKINKEPNESGRRQFTLEQKFKIVKEALSTALGVSCIFRKYGVSASNFYQWQERFSSGAIEGLKRSKT
jgi:transposase-like protein